VTGSNVDELEAAAAGVTAPPTAATRSSATATRVDVCRDMSGSS